MQFGATTFAAAQANNGGTPAATTPVTFTITRTTDPTDTTTMNWTATNDATNPMVGGFSADVTSGSVTFAPGQTSQTVTINVSTPTSFQSQLTGTIDLSLTDPGTNSPASVLGSASTATAVVAYAQPQNLGLSVSTAAVNEADGTLSVTINRTGAGTGASRSRSPPPTAYPTPTAARRRRRTPRPAATIRR